jgi:hypothetical protein
MRSGKLPLALKRVKGTLTAMHDTAAVVWQTTLGAGHS